MVNKRKGTKKKKEEKVCEVFEVEKEGKEEIKESCGVQEVEEVKEGQIKEENKLLRNVLIIVGAVLVLFLAVYFFAQSVNTFKHDERVYDIMDEGSVRFYHTAFPWTLEGKPVTYNIYLRRDPRKNEKNIPFEGELTKISKAIAINFNGDFNCEGDGILATANFNQIFTAFGAQVMNDPNATCDEQQRYTYISIEEGDKTKIIQNSPTCYTFQVNNCEILDVTERFITESLIFLPKE